MRAENRHNRQRKIAASKRVLQRRFGFSSFCSTEKFLRMVRKKARTPKSCSCDMCCNPRRCCGADNDPHRDKKQTNYDEYQERLYNQD